MKRRACVVNKLSSREEMLIYYIDIYCRRLDKNARGGLLEENLPFSLWFFLKKKNKKRKKGRGGERSGATGTRGEVLGGSPGWRRASAGGALVGWIDGFGNEEIPMWETTKVECGGGDGWDISLDFRVWSGYIAGRWVRLRGISSLRSQSFVHGGS